MKALIVGLGNPGKEYEFTRHNIGFLILDNFSNKENLSWKVERYASVTTFRIKGRELILIKPSTYMNLSGKAVKYWMEKEKISLESLLVLCDDISLPFGKIRIRSKGSDGGHNGLLSIIESLGTENFSRLRFGIGNDFPKGMQVEYVLGKWKEEELKELPKKIDICIEAIISFVLIGIDKTMNIYNK